ncbi:MAG: S8 family serine peptidase [Candidatus Riflebacteria bacterium]|nr:S8 family serine peptidase [Candidatus Riflebacteria bacterium]
MRVSTKTIIIAAALTMLSSFPLYSASIEEFQTEEYYGSGGLDLINAAEAYAKGYTGKGITIGINDQPVNLEHESFSSKTGSKYIGSFELNGIDWKTNSHGSHVGGIAAGSKNAKYMHGVAFDADIISTCFMTDDYDFSKYNSYSEIKCINNSWGAVISVDDYYPSEDIEDGIISEKGIDKFVTQLKNNGEYGLCPPIFEAVSKDKLLIFANANQGQHETDLLEFMNWLNGKSVNNLISVTATLNSYGDKKHLERNSDGSITGDFIDAPFSNLAKYYEDSIISAPGWNIYSSDAEYKNNYLFLSGTSQSTPFVTGGAALVQQAFPYLNSKQIGDVLLSTANSNINIDHPFCVTDSYEERQDDEGNTLYDDGYPVYDFYAKIFYIDGRSKSSEEQVKNDLLTFVRRIKDDGDNGDSDAYIIEGAINQGNISVYYQTPIQKFVGQGILDVGKAVSGPGALNARRLEKDNISDKYLTDGQKTVMYEIDTKGYDSVWSNDIKEILVGKLADNNTEEDLKERYNYYNLNWISNNKADKWAKMLTKAYLDEFNNRVDKSGLEGLHVGLLKSGKGVLKLEGNNTYQGATVVTDGAIAVNGSVAGDAYSENEGIITGKGKINGTLYNNNIAIAGDNGEGNLSMGALESKGTLISALNNGENSKFIVDGKANIDGSTVVVAGLLPGESCTVLKADSITGELANSKENTEGISGFLKEYAKIENNEIKYVYDFRPNFEGVSPRQAKAFDAMKRMYFKLLSEYEGEPESASSRGSYRAVTTQQQMAQILTFINLPAPQAGPALSAVVNNAAAQSMTLIQRNSMTGDILSSHFADRFSNKMLPQVVGAGDEATPP